MGSYLRIISLALGLALALGLSAIAFREGGPRYQLVTIRGSTFTLEVATTPEQRARGLRGRSSLEVDAGMLIRVETPQRLSFSTRNTPFPIDILYLDGQGQIVATDQLAANDDRLPGSTSEGDVLGAMLLRGGTASRLRIGPGYRFELQRRSRADE